MQPYRDLQQVLLAAQEVEQQLRDAHLYALRYHKGWERVAELQHLHQQYQEALKRAREGRPLLAEGEEQLVA